VLHGTKLNQVFNLTGIINRAARQLILDIDPQETKRVVEFVNPLFNTVYEYPIAADVKGNRLIDIRPQTQRLPRDVWSQAYNQAFDIAKNTVFKSTNMFTLNFNSGVKTLRINAPFLNAPVILSQTDSLTGNGTWTTGGTASNLSVDYTNFVTGIGSLKFDITTGAGWIENSTLSAIDLTTALNQSSLFVNTYFQTGSYTTSVVLRWGTDSSNYYTSTVTQNQANLAFQNGWNLNQFIWAGATTVGTPTITNIKYVRVTINTTANQTGVRVNGISSILGTIMEYEYYSKYLFKNSSTGAFQETVLTDADGINLDTESYNLLFNLVAHFVMQQIQGLDANFYDGSFFQNEYNNGVERYRNLYRSEVQKPQSTYYYQMNNNSGKYFGRFGNN
jgi:hypothetical protein